MTRVLIPVLALATAGAGVFGYLQKSRADQLEGEFASLRDAMAKQEAAMRDMKGAADQAATLRDDIERLKRERDEARIRSRNVAGAGIGAPGMPPGQAPEMRNFMQGFARQLDDPEVRKTMKANQQMQIAGLYDSLFKKLNLSEEDSKLVAEMLADRNFTALDQGRKLLNGKADDASIKAVRSEIEKTKTESDEKLKGMLGEEKFKELTAFEQTVGDQRALDSVSRAFDRKNISMQPQQKEALANIMREERLKNPTNDIPDLGGGPGMAVLYSEEEVKSRQQQEDAYQSNVLNRASQAGLSPDQVNALRDSFNERNQRRSMGRIMGRAFLGGGGAR
jgi:hypothetical protein